MRHDYDVKYDYDAEYKIGRAKVYIVSPETVLGRKMTDEEIKMVLEDVSKNQSRIYESIALKKQKEKDNI